MFDPAVVEPAVDFLAALAGGAGALELGIGTGRIALPLSRRGVAVHGIDAPPPMLEALRAKPGADQIGITIGDYATATVGATFRPRLRRLQRDHQPHHPGRAGRLLPQRGRPPRARRLLRGGDLRPRPAAAPRRDLPGVRGDADAPRPTSTTSSSSSAARTTTPWSTAASSSSTSTHRYAGFAELDFMARLAGMTLLERWGGWRREPFTSESVSHVSVWQKG